MEVYWKLVFAQLMTSCLSLPHEEFFISFARHFKLKYLYILTEVTGDETVSWIHSVSSNSGFEFAFVNRVTEPCSEDSVVISLTPVNGFELGFNNECRWLIPHNSTLTVLWLNSRVYLYDDENESEYLLYETFAFRNDIKRVNMLGKWHINRGFNLTEASLWKRRSDLSGAEITVAVINNSENSMTKLNADNEIIEITGIYPVCLTSHYAVSSGFNEFGFNESSRFNESVFDH